MRSIIDLILSLFRKAPEPTPVPAPDPAPVTEEKSEEIEMPTPIIVTGWVSEKFESGGRGVSTVSTGNGDNGGVSYGKHQLSTNAGTMAAFLKSEFGKPFTEFNGYTPGTTAFNAVYKSVASKRADEFAAAQAAFIRKTHYEPQAATLEKAGWNLGKRHQAVREMVYSTAVQYGPNTSVLLNCSWLPSDTDEQLITKAQQFKKRSVPTYFKRSSIAVQKSVEDRCQNEQAVLLAFLKG